MTTEHQRMDAVVYIVGGDNWIPCFVSVHSLLSNNNHPLKVFIVSEEDKENPFFENIDWLNHKHNQLSVDFLPVSEKQLNSLPGSNLDHIPKAINLKLLLSDLIPEKYNNILYLDSDTVIDGPIKSLFTRDLSECVLAAAPDARNRVGELGLSLEKRYFNAGVMYINLENWERNNIRDRCIDFIDEYNPKANEQTALNVILHKNDLVDIVSPKYNYTTRWYECAALDDVYIDTGRNKNIIHYQGASKPWHSNSNVPYKGLWLDYYRETPFTEFYPKQMRSKWVSYTAAALEPFPVLKSLGRCVYKSIK